MNLYNEQIKKRERGDGLARYEVMEDNKVKSSFYEIDRKVVSTITAIQYAIQANCLQVLTQEHRAQALEFKL